MSQSTTTEQSTKEEVSANVYASLFGLTRESSQVPLVIAPTGITPSKTAETSHAPKFNIPIKSEIPSHLLPKGFNTPEASEVPAELLPVGFNVPEKQNVPKSLLPKGFIIPEKLKVPKEITEKSEFPAHLLPAGFNVSVEQKSSPSKPQTTKSTTEPTRKGPKGLLFPKRINRPSYLTTTRKPTTKFVAPPEVGSLKKTIVNIFDKLKNAPRTTFRPYIPEKKLQELKEVAKSTTPMPSSSTTTSTTTTTTTTTTQRPRITTPGVCGEKCRLTASLRITGGAEWVPELANRDTKEWQTLAKSITNELDALYQRSPINRWFIGVEIDSFTRGSILVDYFVQLDNLTTGIDTVDLKLMINEMLSTDDAKTFTLGNMEIDPKSTDFVVMQERQRSIIRDDGSYLIPEWLIAVIVISLASFLFIIIFGITVLVSRARVRRRNVPLTEEMLNKMNATQLAGVNNYAHDSVYDMEAIWNDKMADRNMKPPSSRGRGYNPNYNINIYDSWRSDWSGPYGSSATYAKRRPEANF